jgi:hypothetical protein
MRNYLKHVISTVVKLNLKINAMFVSAYFLVFSGGKNNGQWKSFSI